MRLAPISAHSIASLSSFSTTGTIVTPGASEKSYPDDEFRIFPAVPVPQIAVSPSLAELISAHQKNIEPLLIALARSGRSTDEAHELLTAIVEKSEGRANIALQLLPATLTALDDAGFTLEESRKILDPIVAWEGFTIGSAFAKIPDALTALATTELTHKERFTILMTAIEQSKHELSKHRISTALRNLPVVLTAFTDAGYTDTEIYTTIMTVANTTHRNMDEVFGALPYVITAFANAGFSPAESYMTISALSVVTKGGGASVMPSVIKNLPEAVTALFNAGFMPAETYNLITSITRTLNSSTREALDGISVAVPELAAAKLVPEDIHTLLITTAENGVPKAVGWTIEHFPEAIIALVNIGSTPGQIRDTLITIVEEATDNGISANTVSALGALASLVPILADAGLTIARILTLLTATARKAKKGEDVWEAFDHLERIYTAAQNGSEQLAVRTFIANDLLDLPEDAVE